MPRIDDNLLNSVVYLYPSIADATEGYNSGGSGFLIGVRLPHRSGRVTPYVVTNSHVIREASALVIRLNRKDGTVHIIESVGSSWHHHPDGDDIAVAEIGLRDEHLNILDISLIHSDRFITREVVQKYNIGPGDEVFLAGRLIGHDGRQRNAPSVRFGYVAMLPVEGIKHPRGLVQESFLVELFSLGGYSGAPVFVFFRPFSLRPGGGEPTVTTTQTHDTIEEHNIGPLLLGINWGHIQVDEPVRERDGTPIPDGWKVKSNSGMAGVVPAWKLQELLDINELAQRRELLK